VTESGTRATARVAATTIQLLEWISTGPPRTYADVIDAWRTSCPQLSVWEDAQNDRLVACRAGRPQTVVLTPLGRAVLATNRLPARAKSWANR
jgi:hypothetical protein